MPEMHTDGRRIRIIEPVGDGKWRLLAPGGLRATAVADSSREAEQRGREVLRNLGGGELRVYGEDGALLATHMIDARRTLARDGSKTYRWPRGTYTG
jgi:hypothetical protein